ncbi:MAG: aminotransferase class I/II-fold pyridoxal phosphate-dependent enzyme, partial [Clostridia bacterium]|nr:aminotransferase class I/II-fold pyridoxal phosphate-dependent enzyme [Clostridia bacterium]
MGIKMGLYNKLEEYSKENYCPMHMPGHKRNIELLKNKFPYNIDITEIYGFDDLHNPEGVIKQIEEKAKELYGSKRSFALINGSTCGILAGIRAVVKQNDTILVARNCHKSVYHAIEMNSLKPIYLTPKINEYGIEESIDSVEVKEKLENNKEIKLIVITSPNYEGYISDIESIVKIAHKQGIPVLVDEAHGAHLKFMKGLEKYEALNSGADIVVQSLHKTLPALTQTAVMHINGELVKEKNIEEQLEVFETSSPSYILMASIEEALDIVKRDGEILFKKYQENLVEFYKKAKKLKNLKIIGNETKEIFDNGKIVVVTENTNITGKELSDILRKEYKIEVEMSSTNYLIAMTSICDSDENFKRLIDDIE